LNNQKVWEFRKMELSPQIRLDRSWVRISMLQPCNGSKEKTHSIVGDRLLISLIHQLPQMRTFPAWDKYKHTQALPLKEDFRQLPGQVTGQVFQTTWRKRNYTSKQVAIKAKQSKFKELSN
jgi:hypothetical protein